MPSRIEAQPRALTRHAVYVDTDTFRRFISSFCLLPRRHLTRSHLPYALHNVTTVADTLLKSSQAVTFHVELGCLTTTLLSISLPFQSIKLLLIRA